MSLRKDNYTASVINYGLAMHAEWGAYLTGKYLAERGVPAKVASRVLTKPAKRRS